MRLHPGFLRAAFHKMQLLQHGVSSFESISQDENSLMHRCEVARRVAAFKQQVKERHE